MSRRSIMNEPDVATEINLSPMIDCIFILLIFFIVTTVFVEEPGIDVFKPDATVDAKLEKNSIIIAISADNKIVYGGKELGIGGLGARVRQLLYKDQLPVIIQADSRADHGVFSDVWSEVKNSGAKKISVSTRND
ncbi:MAG: biopolymer transporter ExbD [bacterium TMED88]|jgi:biopolymer transport protein ExbD|nr:biopolymer transporter ExbD [Deltaproteobacteria bacterium]MAT48059.1 biopolymer transporter ExbD [Verrucomicrobiaceae bacterium]OUV30425.1 MAG: biopolymer transporter ExbD [bacterium TMED88]